MTTKSLPEAIRLADQLKERFGATVPTSQAAAMLRRLHDEVQALTAQRDVAMHDIRVLQAELDGRPSAPFALYGQCETCGVYSDSAKALHDARRNCGS